MTTPRVLVVDDDDGVNLFLYRVVEDTFSKNVNPPRDKPQPRRPPLSLNLYYLLTGYAKKSNGAGQDDVTAHQLFGNAMAILHEYPVLNDIHDGDFDADVSTQFAPELHDAKVVEHGRGRSIISQCFKPRERFVVTFQVELRQRGEKLRTAGERRFGRHWLHRFQRLRMIALLLVYIPQG